MRDSLIASQLDGYDPEVGAALWRLEEGRARTLRILEDVPDEYLDADAGGNTVGTILYHIALIEADWLYAEILERPFPEPVEALFPVDDRDEAGVLTLVSGHTLDQHLGRLGAVRRTLLDELRELSSAEFHRPRTLPSYDVSPAWVLHHLTQHEAEHRGEIGAVITSLRSRNG